MFATDLDRHGLIQYSPSSAQVRQRSPCWWSPVCWIWQWLRWYTPSPLWYFIPADNENQDRGYAVREPLPLPTQPPYTAHVGNLAFDATSADISDLFVDCAVTNVRIVEDKLTKAPKGFGYVEFETVDGLKKALDLSGATLQGRTIRVSIAEPRK
ncbi:unnamed protein product [Aspergillus oryzae]|uniref:Unnamed protein product n=2 Tax=Aspergillus oryzae TaxID=5062 RepID=A0AAN4YQS8_ASPOZ|nr:unnamed protein product [Aspergillus oryzae]GMF87527.1 unnamed protein product [Aspergillus oryzae]GMG08249.1 unnamed protein product [Aspergillus oryzae]GMG32963.1 unnamed protein product [Aspergillus oryzae]GMG53599.1 unnamed protein product [Aspergillus oryzae var. brunneus]